MKLHFSEPKNALSKYYLTYRIPKEADWSSRLNVPADGFSPDPKKLMRQAMRMVRRPLALVVLAELFQNGFDLLIPVLVGYCLNVAVASGISAALFTGVLGLLALAAAAAIGNALYQYSETGQICGILNGLNDQCVKSIHKNPSGLVKYLHGTGEILSIFSSDTGSLTFYMRCTTQMLASYLAALVAFGVMLSINWPLALCLFITLPLTSFLVIKTTEAFQKRQAKARNIQGDLSSISNDTVAGLRILRGIGAEDTFIARYREKSRDYMQAQIKAMHYGVLNGFLSQIVPMLSTVLVAAWGAFLVVDGNMSIGGLVSFLGLASYLTGPINKTSWWALARAEFKVKVPHLSNLFDYDPLIKDGDKSLAFPAENATVHYPLLSDKELEQLRRTKDSSGDDSAVDDDQSENSEQTQNLEADLERTYQKLDLTDPGFRQRYFKGGKHTALVSTAPNTAGQIALRLARLNDNLPGATLVFSSPDADQSSEKIIEIRDLSLAQSYETLIVSPALNQIFSGTLADVVRGRAFQEPQKLPSLADLVEKCSAYNAYLETNRQLDTSKLYDDRQNEAWNYLQEANARVTWRSDGDNERVKWALDVALADDAFDSLGGLNGQLDERGRNVSGGQRQRLALARAVYAKTPILVLIEPTSALDSSTEDEVSRRLQQARRGQTTITVTTSPLMLKVCDEVLLVDEYGNPLARGSHYDLWKNCPEYRRTISRQEA